MLLVGFWAIGVTVGAPKKHKDAQPAATSPAPVVPATTALPPAPSTKAAPPAKTPAPPPKGTTAAPAPEATTHTDPAVKPGTACYGQQWPQAVPNVVGKDLSTGADPLLCFEVAAATAPDGHDVMKDAANIAYQWTVKSMEPAAGTPVEPTTPIRLTVTR
ncbi:hypothetical protein [Embleya sp. MST-111070]|uniref:hypothetical protein n=1 Tax=Embleya sp. MST-111070 TaxID=3398231 RepID=UPI003F7363B6